MLPNVFEAFQNACLKYYKLDPTYLYTAPELAQQALLKTTFEYRKHEAKHNDCDLYQNRFRLELLRNIDMLLIFEKSIRGRITKAVKRFAKANKKYIKDKYNNDEASKYFQYFDVKNLYGWVLIQKMTTHPFVWMKKVGPGKIDKLVKKISEAIFYKFIQSIQKSYTKSIIECLC